MKGYMKISVLVVANLTCSYGKSFRQTFFIMKMQIVYLQLYSL